MICQGLSGLSSQSCIRDRRQSLRKFPGYGMNVVVYKRYGQSHLQQLSFSFSLFLLLRLSQLRLRDISGILDLTLTPIRTSLVQSSIIFFNCLRLEPWSQASQVSHSSFLLLLQRRITLVFSEILTDYQTPEDQAPTPLLGSNLRCRSDATSCIFSSPSSHRKLHQLSS